MSLKHKKSSALWEFFDIINEKEAKCKICKVTLSYKTSTSNLKKHYERKHPSVQIPIGNSVKHELKSLNQIDFQKNIDLEKDDHPNNEVSSKGLQPQSSEQIKTNQKKLTSYVNTKLCKKQKSKIDEWLMKMIIENYHPFSIVNEAAFKGFVKSLNPSYELPSRQIISKTMIPAMYEQKLVEVQEKTKCIVKCSLTTDCWTSEKAESYIAVTVHFIDENFEFQNLLLDCSYMETNHTSANLKKELERVIEDWSLKNKIKAIVSDNASNIKKAINDMPEIEHLGCFAHTINLIVNSSIKGNSEVQDVIDKVQKIVTHFKKSTAASLKLKSYQRNNNMEEKQLIKNVATRWNSTFFMLKRFLEMEEPLKCTIAVIDKVLPTITTKDWIIIKSLIELLEPFEETTRFISGEHYITASNIIICAYGLHQFIEEALKKEWLKEIKDVLQNFQNNIQSRWANIEQNLLLSISCFLDPRFKDAPFKQNETSVKVKQILSDMIIAQNSTAENSTNPDLKKNQDNEQNATRSSIWNYFDLLQEKYLKTKPAASIYNKASIEIERYLEEGLINRSENPLNWWKKQHNYPCLRKIAKEFLCIVATSVPCERIFSKAGNILTEKRSRLKDTKVKQLLFLESNIKYCDS